MAGQAVLPEVGSDYADYGCQVNAFTVDEVFAAYERSRFLYPTKARRLAPHWSSIRSHWQSALRGGELIQYVVTYGDLRNQAWATLTSWRSTHQGWVTQHLVSTGGPVASRAVMLAGQAVRIRDGWDHAHQNWHRPDHKFAAPAFTGMVAHLPPGTAAVFPGAYLAVPRRHLRVTPPRTELRILALGAGPCEELATLARRCRSQVYVSAEELDGPDLLLDEVDRLYRLVGLRRYRRIWMALTRTGLPVAAAIAYRGPLGLNFSFLENRCDLLLSSECPPADVAAAVAALLGRAASTYDDLPLDTVMVTCDHRTAATVMVMGGKMIQPYTQSICLERGFPAWYSYIDSLYARRLTSCERG
jgi:hypothetical protein